MRILIIGDGKVGHTLASQLSNENHDIVIVDNNAEALRKAVEKLDVLCIQGSGTNQSILREAGIEKIDLVIAVTSSDEVNIVCSLLAHKLSRALIITRIRNPEYVESEAFIKDALGISMCMNPEQSAANEIFRLLRFPQAYSIESFVHGLVDMIEFQLTADCPILGRPLSEIMKSIPAKILISIVKRNHEIYIANGNTILEAGDHVYVVGESRQNSAFSRFLGLSDQKIRNVMIVGGGRIAYYLAQQLRRLKMRTRLIEKDPHRCEQLYHLLEEVLIINGDGTDYDLLDQENLPDMDAFISLTDRDEENIIAGLHALDSNVQKVVVKVTKGFYSKITKGLSIISPKDLTANRIVRFVRGVVNSEGSFVESLYRIEEGKAEVMEFKVKSSSHVTNTPLRLLDLKPNILVAAIVHKDRITIPFGDDIIREGDSVVIVTNGEYMFLDLNDILIGR